MLEMALQMAGEAGGDNVGGISPLTAARRHGGKFSADPLESVEGEGGSFGAIQSLDDALRAAQQEVSSQISGGEAPMEDSVEDYGRQQVIAADKPPPRELTSQAKRLRKHLSGQMSDIPLGEDQIASTAPTLHEGVGANGDVDTEDGVDGNMLEGGSGGRGGGSALVPAAPEGSAARPSVWLSGHRVVGSAASATVVYFVGVRVVHVDSMGTPPIDWICEKVRLHPCDHTCPHAPHKATQSRRRGLVCESSCGPAGLRAFVLTVWARGDADIRRLQSPR